MAILVSVGQIPIPPVYCMPYTVYSPTTPHMKRLLLLLSTISLLLSTTVVPAGAQEAGIRLSTSPLPINLQTEPGATVSTDLRVRNSGSQTETLKVGLLTFSAEGQTGAPKLRERQAGDDFFDWVRFSEDTFTISPNEWHTITMTIAVPESAAFGYYYAVTFSREGAVYSPQDQAKLIGATATLVLLDVDAPGAKRDLSIASFKTDRPWYEFLPVSFLTTIRNSGNVHAVATGNIFISRAGSKETISTLKVNEAVGNILPDSGRVFTTDWTEGFPVYADVQSNRQTIYKNGQSARKLEWDLSKANQLRFGKYTAHLVMAYDNGSRDVPLEKTIEFWVIPWRLFLAAVAIPVVPAVLVYVFMRWRMRRDEY